MPNITQIQDAATLQTQLDLLLKSIDALAVDGASVTSVTIMPGPPADPSTPGPFYMAVGLTLDPPITDAATLAELSAALFTQAEGIQQQLVDLGYVDDISSGTLTRYREEHGL